MNGPVGVSAVYATTAELNLRCDSMLTSTKRPCTRSTEKLVPTPLASRADFASSGDHPAPSQNCHGPGSPPAGTRARWTKLKSADSSEPYTYVKPPSSTMDCPQATGCPNGSSCGLPHGQHRQVHVTSDVLVRRTSSTPGPVDS